jgi:hypothetical protein
MEDIESVEEQMKDWLAKLDPKWVVTNVVGWSFLAVVLYAVYEGMVLPAQTEHFKLVNEVARNNTSIARTQERQTPILERIERNTSK